MWIARRATPSSWADLEQTIMTVGWASAYISWSSPSSPISSLWRNALSKPRRLDPSIQPIWRFASLTWVTFLLWLQTPALLTLLDPALFSYSTSSGLHIPSCLTMNGWSDQSMPLLQQSSRIWAPWTNPVNVPLLWQLLMTKTDASFQELVIVVEKHQKMYEMKTKKDLKKLL